VLRSELTHRFGVWWGPIVNGQAEIAGMPKELLSVFSKRAADIDVPLAAKVETFRDRHGCEPSHSQRAAMVREAAQDTRGRKSGHGAPGLVTRWQREAADSGWTVEQLVAEIEAAARQPTPAAPLTVGGVVAAVSAQHSSWGRPDVLQAVCDEQRPVSQMSARRWLDTLERGADRVLERCVDLDPPDATRRRASDGRSLWIEPTAPRFTSEAVLAEEEHIVTWAIDAQSEPAAPSATVDRDGLDVLQAEAAASVAGADRLVLVVGPAGAGKTRMLAAAVADLHDRGRAVFGVAPTAKAARVLERDTGMRADTFAKLLHEWEQPDRPPRPEFQLPPATTIVVDEAAMLSTPALHQLVLLAEANRWRLALVGDHRQLQAVGRGGLYTELCTNGRVDELEQLHRFTHDWEAEASLLLRSGDPRALDAYQANGRIIPGTFDEHLERIAEKWIQRHQDGDTVGLIASTNEHVDAINAAVQTARVDAGQLNNDNVTSIAAGEHVCVGDVVATRRNDRTLITSAGDHVHNRETWTVTAVGTDGSLTVTRERGHGTVTLPADYAHDHVRLGYAATQHGYQSDTVDHSISLVAPVTTRRGLYVAATRGRDDNVICVVTDNNDLAEARDTLEAILAFHRADIPAVTQRRSLADQQPPIAARQRQAATPRCEIPDWFEPLLAELRRELDVAEQEATVSEYQRGRLVASVARAQHDLARIDAATAPARAELAAAMSSHHEAGRTHALAEHRLDVSGLRGRRAARHNLDAAHVELEHAIAHLQRTRQHTRTHVDHYEQERARVGAARDALDRHDQRAPRLGHTFDQIPVLRRQIESLGIWRRWARGDTVNLQQPGDAVAQLTSQRPPGEHTDHFRTLAYKARDWAGDAGIELSTTTHGRTIERAGLGIGP
jgi:hypothetical protein